MERDPEHGRVVTVQDEAQGPFVPLDLDALFTATRSSATADESTEDGAETTGLSNSVDTETTD
ncbi:hypothetical protein [Actinoplanes sp. NPDC051411]|uniref:hypothetical protein n=1 Tax=Actinoplanes sp. NPDC051411 TaxID=3155522 RepID=UPI0034135729